MFDTYRKGRSTPRCTVSRRRVCSRAGGRRPRGAAAACNGIVLLFVALGAAVAALPSLRRGGGPLLRPLAVSRGALGAASLLGVLLSFEWAAAVPGTPSWLLLIPAGQLVLALAAAVLLGRALLVERAV